MNIESQILDALRTRERTAAELCFMLDLDSKRGPDIIERAINRLEAEGHMFTENQTENNTWYGLYKESECLTSA